MALKGVIQGQGGTGGGQLSGSGVTSVALTVPAPFITGPPVTSAGTLTFDFSGVAIPVADGGTGMGSFAANSLIQAGLGSSSKFQSIPLSGLTSTFLDGSGNFSTPTGTGGGGAGTVTSVALTASPEFIIQGSPITSAGTLNLARSTPAPVSAGGTGLGSFLANSILQAGPSSTAPFTSVALNNLTSNFLRGDGVFAAPPPPPAGGTGTVTSVDLALSSEFTVSGNPITTAGQLVVGWRGPLAVAHGGTGMGSFGPSVVLGGLNSNAPLQGLPLTTLTSTFLAGDGVFRIPVNPGGTVQSVALSMTSEFAVLGSPILGSGTFTIGFTQPLAVAHGGTGLGSIGIGAVLRGGLSSTAPLQGTPLTSLTSTFLDGTGNFSTPVNSVASVGLTAPGEFVVQNTPVVGVGTLGLAFNSPVLVAHGGTGMGSFAANSILQAGPSSTAPHTSIVLPNLTSSYLRGDGVFAPIPSVSAGGGSGTVTSVALVMSSEFIIAGSPITTSGTFLGSWVFQSANFFFGGPGTGTPGTPAFRQLLNADIPQSLSGKTLTSSTFQNPTISTQLLTFGSSIKWNMNSGAIGLLGMDSTAFGTMDTPANVANTGAAILRIMQLGTGLPNLAWNNFWKFETVGGIRTPPTLSSGFSNIDVISLYMESTAAYGVARKKFG